MTSSPPYPYQRFKDAFPTNSNERIQCLLGHSPDGASISSSIASIVDSDSSAFEDNTDPTVESWLHRTFVILYALVFLLGVTGNALVVFIVVRRRAMHTVFNVFLANLSVADVLICFLAVPFTPFSVLHNWVLGDVLCHVVPMTLGVTVHVSTMTSTAIAVNRYVIVVHPYRQKMTPASSVILVASIWVLSVLVSLPLAVYQAVEWDERDGSVACLEAWPSETSKQLFTVGSILLQYLVPCGVIVFCYVNVSVTLAARARTTIGSGRTDRSRVDMELTRNRRTNRMLIAMVSIFALCWMPLNVFHVVNDYSDVILQWKHFYGAFLLAHLISMSSTVYNPFLYAWMNAGFREEFQLLLAFPVRRPGRCSKTKSQLPPSGDERK